MNCKDNNIEVSVSDDFARQAKRLSKKYPSFKSDYKKFLESNKSLLTDSLAYMFSS